MVCVVLVSNDLIRPFLVALGWVALLCVKLILPYVIWCAFDLLCALRCVLLVSMHFDLI